MLLKKRFRFVLTTLRFALSVICLFVSTSNQTVQATYNQPPPVCPDPAGWGHGGRPSGLGEDLPPPCGGHINLQTFVVSDHNTNTEPIGRLGYAAPAQCRPANATYTIDVQAKESNYEEQFTVVGHEGEVDLLLGVKPKVIGPQMLHVRISSGICHALADGVFEIAVVNELF